MLNPQRHHTRNHRDTGVAFADCWVCGRDRAVCQAKLRFATWAEADEWALDFNVELDWVNPVVRYRCRWCEQWHLKTAKDVRTRARVERYRRKWLISKGAGVT